MPEYYTLENFKRAIRNPNLFLYEIRRIAGIPLYHMYDNYVNNKLKNGIDVMDENWDNLIILDACRHDYFAAQNSVPHKTSSASCF